MSHEIQDEILRMSHQILRSILKDVSSSLWYSVIADEAIDASLSRYVNVVSVNMSASIQFNIKFYTCRWQYVSGVWTQPPWKSMRTV